MNETLKTFRLQKLSFSFSRGQVKRYVFKYLKVTIKTDIETSYKFFLATSVGVWVKCLPKTSEYHQKDPRRFTMFVEFPKLPLRLISCRPDLKYN